LLARLAGLLLHTLTGVAHALAGVRLGGANRPDVRGEASDELFVHGLEVDAGELGARLIDGLDVDRDALGDLHERLVAHPDGHLEDTAVELGTVADAPEVEAPL